MYPNQNTSHQTVSRLDEGFEFWQVFIDEIPRVPTVHELICRVIGLHYPEGIITDRNGNFINPSRDIKAVTKRILFTLQVAIDTQREFWTRYLQQARVIGPFAQAVRLEASAAMDAAEAWILGALEWVGNVHQLDVLYHEAYLATVNHCTEEGRQILWAPFGDSGEVDASIEDAAATENAKKEDRD